MSQYTDTFPFEGAYWLPINMQEDGSIDPPPTIKQTDRLRVKSAFHFGPDVFNVANMTKCTQSFVQFRYKTGYNAGPQARCNNLDCVKWQHTQARQKSPCKHVRAAARWFVTLSRRAKRLALRGENDEQFAA